MSANPRLEAVCVAVRRRRCKQNYSPADYEVCLESIGGVLSLPMWVIDHKNTPAQEVLSNIRTKMKLTATQSFALKVYGRPEDGPKNHRIATLFAIPVAVQEEAMAGDYKFYPLAEVLDCSQGQGSQHQFKQNHRNMLYSVDQWLRERHAIPFVNVDLLFLCNKEGEGMGGLVKAIIENPLHSAKVQPPEDNLVISLNNPIFKSVNNGLPEANTNTTSNAQ